MTALILITAITIVAVVFGAVWVVRLEMKVNRSVQKNKIIAEVSERLRCMGQRIYIAGPMTGLPNYNYHAFDAKAEELRAHGHTVINPADIGRAAFGGKLDPSKGALKSLLSLELMALKSCDAIYMLPNWEQSRGARIEHRYAARWGKIIIEECK